jgi:hypothetical protein
MVRPQVYPPSRGRHDEDIGSNSWKPVMSGGNVPLSPFLFQCYLCLAVGTLALKPIKQVTAFHTFPLVLLYFEPIFSAVFLHIRQIFDYMDMVGYVVDHVDVFKVFQPLTREFVALEAPGYTFL